jgi:hypothetical protein
LSGDTGYLLVFSLVPFLAGLCDFAENVCLRHVCARHSVDRNLTGQRRVVEWASAFTKQKWACIRLGVTLTALVGIHALYHSPIVSALTR